jgi:hypothetical protein
MADYWAVLLRRVQLTMISLTFLAISACGAKQDPSYTENLERQSTNGPGEDSTRGNKEVLSPEDLEAAKNAKAIEEQGGNPKVVDGSLPPGSLPPGSLPPGTKPNVNYVSFTQSLTQPPLKPVDILWIVDSSGSMSEEQSYLATNFSSFITTMKSSGVQFQTSVTSTDICDPYQNLTPECPVAYGGSFETHLQGSFVGSTGRKVLKDSDTDLVDKFNTYAKVGTNGSGFEHGMRAAHLAIQKTMSGANEALIRSNAFLSVIVVSDEEDDGIGLSMTDSYSKVNYTTEGLTNYKYTHTDFINYATSVKGQGNFAVTAITGTKGDDGLICTSAHSKPTEEGTQYINAAKGTGGKVQSICDTNWSTTLAEIGQDLTAQISQIRLTKVPVAGSIKVSVNGKLVTNWEYAAANQSIKFLASSTPPPGAAISVTYLTTP